MKTIRWGIIGCGNVTEVKSGPGFQKAKNSALMAVMRRDADKARDYAARHGAPKWYGSADDLVHDPDVDAVYVATPPSSHEEYAMLAAKAGKPVYIEKPMARTFDECRRMIEACRSAGTPLFVAYYRRCLPRFVKVKELVESGAIGDVRFVSVMLYQPPERAEFDPANLPWRVVPEIAGAGLFLDLASHTLDVLDYILGPIEKARGMASNQAGLYAAEDIVTANWAFVSGALGAGVWCFTSRDRSDMNEIVGAKGKISFSSFGNEPIRLTTKDGIEEFPLTNPLHVQQPLIQTIVDELNGVGRCPSSGESASRTSWVMDEILNDWRAAHA